VNETEIRGFLTDAIRAAREILTEYRGYGDLRLAFRLDLADRALHFDADPRTSIPARSPHR
jgi:hypothetical protein